MWPSEYITQGNSKYHEGLYGLNETRYAEKIAAFY